MKALVVVMLAAGVAHADEIIFARGDTLYTLDGKQERELVKASAPVKSLRAAKRVVLVELVTGWAWLDLDSTTTKLASLPCTGAAQLAPDAACVICNRTIVNLATGKQTPIAIPDAWIAGNPRVLVWADAGGVFPAPPAAPTKPTKVAPEAPQRGLLPSPDGKRAVGVYGDILMTFDLDGTAARRKGIRNGVPVAWSADSQYVLVQDGTAACLMRAGGGQYKCWKGYTAIAVAPNAAFAIVAAKGHLYRSKLDGPHDGTPELIVKDATAAAWLQGA